MAKVPDNFWKEDSPARMADGRIFTDYYPNCSMNLSIQKNKRCESIIILLEHSLILMI